MRSRSVPTLFALVLPLLAMSGASAQSSPLVTPAELQALLPLDDVRVVDIREGKTDEGRTLYQTGHVPGAVSSPYSRWRGPKENPGELPALEKLTAAIDAAGLSPSTHAVIVSAGTDSTDFGAAARVYWTLKVSGLKKLSILNGGHKAWVAAGLPVRSDTPEVAASDYTPVLDASMIATRDEVAALDASKVRLVDARPKAFFEGSTRHAAARVPGTLVGARHFDNARWFRPGTATFVAPDEARRIAAEGGLDATAQTVSFCNTGHWASTNWFAMSEILGFRDVAMYPGSMVDWSRADLPMANVPNRAEQLLIDAKLWWARNFR